MKRAKTLIDEMQPKAWMDYMFDHTVIIAEDDIHMLSYGKAMERDGVIQLREVTATGAEKFAELVFDKLNNFVKTETNGRVCVAEVEFMENNKNSAIYRG